VVNEFSAELKRLRKLQTAAELNELLVGFSQAEKLDYEQRASRIRDLEIVIQGAPQPSAKGNLSRTKGVLVRFPNTPPPRNVHRWSLDGTSQPTAFKMVGLDGIGETSGPRTRYGATLSDGTTLRGDRKQVLQNALLAAKNGGLVVNWVVPGVFENTRNQRKEWLQEEYKRALSNVPLP
jgi:hypothetical protein